MSNYKDYVLSGKPVFSLKLAKESSVDFKYDDRVVVSSPYNVFKFLDDFMGDSPREKFVVVFLDAGNSITGIHVASEGGLDVAIVEPRAVFGPAILANAKSVILAHNHPSGNLKASKQDIRLTERLVEAGEIMGIQVLDHLIIADGDYRSLQTEIGF